MQKAVLFSDYPHFFRKPKETFIVYKLHDVPLSMFWNLVLGFFETILPKID